MILVFEAGVVLGRLDLGLLPERFGVEVRQLRILIHLIALPLVLLRVLDRCVHEISLHHEALHR